MSIGRENIYSTFYNLVKTATGIAGGAYRQWRNVRDMDPSQLPAVFMVQLGETPEQVKGLPTIWKLHVDLYLYTVAPGPAPSPSDAVLAPTLLNNAMDALENLLAPDPVTQVQTLGGLVSHAWLSGRTQTDEGTLGDKAYLIVGVDMLVEAPSTNQFLFDSGSLFVLPAGALAPVQIGSLQSIQADATFEIAEERGHFLFPIRVMNKKNSLVFTAKMARINGAMFNQVAFGNTATPSTGSINLAAAAAAVPASPGPYTVTPAVPGGGTWSQDLGVFYDSAAAGAKAGQQLTAVDSGPGPGQYSVAAGVYTFNAAEATQALTFNFLYTLTTGVKAAIANQPTGPAPTFMVVLNNSSTGGQMTWLLNNVRSDALNILTRLENHALPDFKFTAQADSSNNVGTMSYSH